MERSFRKYPALPALVSVIAGILPFALFPEMPFSGAAFFISALMICSCFFCRSVHHALWYFSLPLFIGFLASYLAVSQPEIPSGVKPEMFSSSGIYGDFDVIISDSAVSPQGDFPANPRPVKARLVRYTPYGTDECRTLQPGIGVGLLIHPSHSFRPGYGDLWRIRGLLTVPEGITLPETFDYGKYLRKEGIFLQLEALRSGVSSDDSWDDDDRTPELLFPNEPAAAVRDFSQYPPVDLNNLCFDDVTLLQQGGGFHRMMFDLRDRILHRICDGMTSEGAKGLAAGILFGFPQTLGNEIKNDFFRSGTIHILTVSGTHVGLFAALLFLIFFFLPGKFRIIPVLILTFFYAAVTGMREPAMRACFMLAVFLLAGSFRCKTNAMNTLALIAALLLIFKPENLTSAGFQFSFIIVAALLFTSRWMSHIYHFLCRRGNWVPSERRKRSFYWRNRIFSAFAGAAASSLIAFAASVPLTICYQGQITFNSIWVNILLIPLVFFCFVFALLSCIWSGFQMILQDLLESILYLCDLAARDGVLDLAEPAPWSIALYYACFFFLFLPDIRKNIRMFCLCGLILLPVYWYCTTVFAEREMLVMSSVAPDSDGIALSVVLTDPASRSADVMNLPDFRSAMEIKAFLRKRGIGKVNVFLARHGRTSSGGGMKYLAPLPVEHAYLHPRQTRYAGGIALREYFPDWRKKGKFFEDRNLTLYQTGDTFSAVFRRSGTTLTVSRPAGGGTRLRSCGRFTLDETFSQSLCSGYIILRETEKKKVQQQKK